MNLRNIARIMRLAVKQVSSYTFVAKIEFANINKNNINYLNI